MAVVGSVASALIITSTNGEPGWAGVPSLQCTTRPGEKAGGDPTRARLRCRFRFAATPSALDNQRWPLPIGFATPEVCRHAIVSYPAAPPDPLPAVLRRRFHARPEGRATLGPCLPLPPGRLDRPAH